MQSTVLGKSSIFRVGNVPSLHLEEPSMTALQEPHLRRVVKREADRLTHVSPAEQILYFFRSLTRTPSI